MGLVLKRELEDGATLSLWEIIETEEQLLLLGSIPNEELEELQLIKNAARRKEKLAVRALLDVIFEEKFYLGHHDNGRPFLQNSLIEISISHTSRYACILTHPYESVGVDIEKLSRNFSVVEKRALSDEERENLSDRDRELHLAIYWSAKEAVFKRMSRSGIDFAKQIFIKKFNPKESGELTAVFLDKDGDQQEFELNYEVYEDHIIAWIIG
ncbi:MAG: 4'-phosphopantetheinyl transferase superfamily protein [Bacteroidales bacterium]